jgi:hypothetical protein
MMPPFECNVAAVSVAAYGMSSLIEEIDAVIANGHF